MSAIFYYIFFSVNWLITLLPLRILYLFSDFWFYIVYYLIGYRKKVVFTNLKNSFPEKSDEEINKIAKKFYRHLCDLVIEILALVHSNEKKMQKHFKVKNPEVLDNIYDQNKSVIVLAAHYGNWEYFLSLPLFLKHKVVAIYKPFSNKYFDNLMISIRKKFGVEPVEMKQTIKLIVKYRREKKLAITAFFSDQSPMKSEINYWTNFLNQDTPVYLGAEKIARKTNQTVVFIKIEKIKRGCYEAEIIKLFDNPKNAQQYEITEEHLRVLEKIINNKPEHWLWSHRRWKHKRIDD